MKNKKNIISLHDRISEVLKNTSNDSGVNKEVIELLQDIQKRDSHQNSQIKHSSLFDHLQEAVAIYEAIDDGKNFKFVNFNAAAEKVDKIKKDKVIGKKVTEVFPGVVEFGFLNVLNQVWKTGIPVDHPITFYEDDRILGWRENYVYKLPTGEIVAAYRDVTEQRKAENELQNSESNLKSLINNKQDSIWSIDTDYNYIIFNDFFKAQYFSAYKIKLEKGINALDILTPELYDLWKEKYDRALSGERVSFEFSSLFNKNKYFYEVSLNPIISNGKIAGVTATSVDVTQHRINEIALAESEENHKIITKSSVDIIFRINQQGKLLYISESAKDFLGYEPVEIIGKSFHLFLAKSSVLNAASKLQSAFQNKNITNFTTKIMHNDGHIINAEINGTYLEKNGELIAQGSIRDITERLKIEKALKQSEENYKGIFETSADAIYILNKDSEFLHVNHGAEIMYGYKSDQLVGKTPAFVSAPKLNDFDKVQKDFRKAYNGKKQKFEFWGLRKNGEIFSKDVTLYPGKYNGEKVVIAIGRDISEKKSAEEKIIKSEKNFKNLIEFAPDPFFQGNSEGNFITCNEAAVELTGYSKKLLLTMNIADLFQSKILNQKPLRYDLLEIGNIVRTERILSRKNGTEVLVEMNSRKMSDGTFQSFMRDITDKRKSENALLQSEEKYRRIVQNLNHSYYEADEKGVITFINPEFKLISEYDDKNLIGTLSFSLIDKEDRLNVLLDYKKALAENKPYIESQFRVNLNNNKTIWVEQLTSFYFDESGAFIKATNVVKDITKRKESEIALKESEERYRRILLDLKQAYYEADSKGLITNCNSELSLYTGYSENELIGKRSFSIVHKEHWRKVINDYQKCLLNKTVHFTSEFKVSIKDGRVYWGEQISHFQYDEKGNFIKVSNIVKDITERKNAEKLLQESEKNFRLLFENSPLGTFVATPDGTILDANKALLKMLGSPSFEETKNINVLTFPPLMKNGYAELFEKCIKNNVTVSLDIAYTSKWGTDNIYSSYLVPLSDVDGKVEKVYTILEDVTQRKIAEDALRESEGLFRNLAVSTATAIFVYQEDKLVFANEATEKLVGYSKEELFGMNFWDVVHPDFKQIVKERGIARQNGQKISNRYQFKLLRKDKTEAWIDFAGDKIIWSGKKAGIGSAIDITDLKIAEEKLLQSEKRYKIITDSTSDYLFSAQVPVTGNSIMDWVGGSFKKITGYTFEEYQKIGSWAATLHPEDVNIDIEAFRELKNNRKAEIEVRIFNKNGKIVWVRCSTSPVWSEKEQRVVTIYGAVKDITEEKNAELAIHESEAKYKLITNLTSDYLFSTKIDESGHSIQTWVGGSFKEITGYNKEEYIEAGGWVGTLHPDHIEADKKAYKKLTKNQEAIIEVKTIHKSGKIVWVESFGSPVWNKKTNKLIGINGAVRDITKEKESSIALQESEEKYKLISNITSDYLFEAQIDENNIPYITWMAGSFEKISGYKIDEYFKLSRWNSLLHEDDIEIEKGALKNLRKNKKIIISERIIHKDGHIVWVKNTSFPIWDYENDKLIGILGAVRDITKEKETSIALKENEEKYKLISNITSDYLFESRYDEKNNLKTVWVAGSFKKMTGYTLEEYQKAGGWSKLLHKDDVNIDNDALKTLKQNKETTLEVRTVHKNGRIIWVKNSCSPIWDNENNKLIGIIGAAKDITNEKNQQLVRQIQYNIANAVINTKNTNELFKTVRSELQKLIDANNFFVAFYNEEKDTLNAIVDFEKEQVSSWESKKSITGRVIESKKKLFLKKDEIISLAKERGLTLNGEIPEVWLGIPLIIGNKVIGAIVVQSYDNPNAYDKLSIDLISVIASQLSLFIERNKAQEDALRLSRAIAHSPVSVVITTPDGNIEYVNPQFEKNSGYTFEEIFGENSRILKSGHHPEEYYKDLWDTLLAGNDWRGEILNKRKNGELYWENVSISPIENTNGKITHFVAIKEDFTEKKNMIAELISSKEKAEISEKVKTEFLAQMSHEIRSPLNVIMNFIGLIKMELDESLSGVMESSFESIDTASSRIIRTIDLILNSTDLQQGSYSSTISEMNVVTTLTKINNEYRHSAEKKGLDIRLNLEFKTKKINSDEYAFIQIISNLVDNAIKYTNEGYIEINAAKDDRGGLIIEIKDTGIGMSTEFLPNLFNSFSQEEQGYTRSYDGNGLGMALVKKYCDIISTKISVKSIKGKGTIFSLSIPNLK